VSSETGGPSVPDSSAITSITPPVQAPGDPREGVANVVANGEAALRAEIEKLQAQLAALRPSLRLVK
jgi:hypothetical protein